MTLDEAIRHAEEVAEEQKKEANEWHENQVRKCELFPFAEMDYTHENECKKCAEEHRQLAEWLKELKAYREAWDKCIKEIKEWYWNADKQAMAEDPCVIDAMVDLFVRTIKEYRPKEGDTK